MTQTFDLADPGTPERDWLAALASRDLPALDLSTFEHLVVVAAHPDDETLGAGGLMATAAALGLRITVVVLTDGAASHPNSPTHSPQELRRIREAEVRHAVSSLAPDASVVTLGLPDGALAEQGDKPVNAIVEAIGLDGASTLLLSPWHADRHPDHAAAAQAASLAAHRTDATHLGYPIWAWHWSSVDEFPWESAVSIDLTPSTVEWKRTAIAAHTSQVEPLSDAPGDEALLPDHVLQHFARAQEILLSQNVIQDQALDDLHDEQADPWNVDESWYERRKRAVTLGLLTRARYESALEVGCSIGALTTDLAERCDRVLGIDASAHAARAATARVPVNAEIQQRDAPEDWPDGRFDLVVLSEVGYFLSPRRWDALLDRVRESLTEGGEVLLCHWLPQPDGWPMDGEVVHEAAIERLSGEGRRVVVQYRDDHVRMEVIGASPVRPD